MNQYVMQRALLVIPTLFGVTFLVFLVLRLQPGTAVAVQCGGQCTPEDQHRVEHSLGLDQPVPVQYVKWVGDVLHGNFGTSILENDSVATQLASKLPVSFEMGAAAMLIGLMIALPVGVISAVKQDTAVDYLVRTFAVALIAVPSFWIATLLIATGAKYKFWTPQLNYVSLAKDPIGNVKILWVPVILLGASLSGTIMRLTRAMMLETMREDYIRTARAKGLRERLVLRRHAIRNAFLPVITLIGLQVPVLIGGSVILETVFSIPGIGRWVVDAVRKNDLPVIQSVNLLVASVVILTNLSVDLLYVVVDPRIRAAH